MRQITSLSLESIRATEAFERYLSLQMVFSFIVFSVRYVF